MPGHIPILLDLDGNGIKITELSKSQKFVDADGEGLKSRMAWAGAGDAVLFYDSNNSGTIDEKKEFIFSEWDPSADTDMDALRSYFDKNGDGKLSGTELAGFKVEVVNADGTTTVKLLSDATVNITEINLKADTTRIVLPDGSIITGQSKFTKGDGTTGTVANTTLSVDGAGNRVDTSVTVLANNHRVITNTGYSKDGDILFKQVSDVGPSGNNTLNSYDDNGDGVYDRVQSVVAATNAGGEKVETVTNRVGSAAANSYIDNIVETTTSVDGKTITVRRDSQGGGWFDQREIFLTISDQSRSHTVETLSKNGTVLASSTESYTTDGLSRTLSIDPDGDSDFDTVVSHNITNNAGGSRTETETVSNTNGSVRSSETRDVSADGRSTVIQRDLGGTTAIDEFVYNVVTVNADGTTSTTETVKNGDNTSIRFVTVTVQSTDAFDKTISEDLNGDGSFDTITHDKTTVNADLSRVHEITVSNQDSSIRFHEKTTLGSNKIDFSQWVDANANGSFASNELVKQVTYNTTTSTQTTQTWDRTDAGGVIRSSTTIATNNGLSLTTTSDEDGDGDTDTQVADITVTNTDSTSTRTVTVNNGDGTLRTRDVIATSASGLRVETSHDRDGNGVTDLKTIDETVVDAAANWTRTVSETSGNGLVTLHSTSESHSADRLTVITTIDSNGDGFADVTHNVTTTNAGLQKDTLTVQNHDHSLASKIYTETLANGLTITTKVDADGDTIYETITTDTTTLAVNGSKTQLVDVTNADGSLRSRTTTTLSDDGFVKTVSVDADGDGDIDTQRTSTTVIASTGVRTTVFDTTNSDNSLRTREQTAISDDGLSVTVSTDRNGDQIFDQVETTVVALQSDGGRLTTVEERDQAGLLLQRTVTAASDDLKSITISQDINGDNSNDRVETRVLQTNGSFVDTITNYDASGVRQSRFQTTTNDDGLIVTSKSDLNGDLVYDQILTDTTVLNNDGSHTRTVIATGANGTQISGRTEVTSDDGLSTTTTWDLDGDAGVERSQTDVLSLALNGETTRTVTLRAENNAILETRMTLTSADGDTVTQTLDRRGDGIVDLGIVRSIAANGDITTTTTGYSLKGTAVSKAVETTSGNGFETTITRDVNLDNWTDFTTQIVTELHGDGSRETTSTIRDRFNVLLGQSVKVLSDDGLTVHVTSDTDGDGVFDQNTEDVTVLNANGSRDRDLSTWDGAGSLMSAAHWTTSDDGLTQRYDADFNGDGGIDYTAVDVENANRSRLTTQSWYDISNSLVERTTTSVSADGRTTNIAYDHDGNGISDAFATKAIDLSQNWTNTLWEATADGTQTSVIVLSGTANGLLQKANFDLDADGVNDILRTTTTTIAADASKVMTTIELTGNTRTYSETTTTSANGLTSTTLFDVDGDLQTDKTEVFVKSYVADGSIRTTSTTTYADGGLRSKWEQTESFDGRDVVTIMDRDGNGVADKSIVTRVDADGASTTTTSLYNVPGYRISQAVERTSADGLVTSIERSNGPTETITRSAVQDQNYTWDNGGAVSSTSSHMVVSHAYDAGGVQTWTVTSTYLEYKVVGHTSGAHGEVQDVYGWVTTVDTKSVRLDDAQSDRLFAQASAIYDAVLDRDMTFAETETLAKSCLANGTLDQQSLVSALLSSSEFTTKYGTMSDAEFIYRIALNSWGRAPTMAELADRLVGTLDRTASAMEFAQSLEHEVAGHGHLSTNNTDLDLTPAVFDRITDAAVAEAMVKRLVDTVYDRDATVQEVSYLSHRLLMGTDKLPDLVATLLAANGQIAGTSSASLSGLSGVNLVRQAFLNAAGHLPSAEQEAVWQSNLASGELTANWFIALLSESTEHLTAVHDHLAVALPSSVAVTGTSGADTLTGTGTMNVISGLGGSDVLTGGTGADRMIGGTEADTLRGAGGHDSYEWSRGDGSDTIDDTGTSQVESDRLVLSGVLSTSVSLTRSGVDLKIAILAASGPPAVEATLTVSNQFESAISGKGLEAIQFSDGTVWNLEDILSHTTVTAASSDETMWGTDLQDNLIGGTGSNTIIGYGGDDQLTGGKGDDALYGGRTVNDATNGSDTYIWSVGDGNDTIIDKSPSLDELDQLVFTNVASTGDVQLTRVKGSADLHIKSAINGFDITVLSQFDSVIGGWGIERITFSDGVVWSLNDIYLNTKLEGTSGADYGSSSPGWVAGSDLDDVIYGYGGDDVLRGAMGNDKLVGGAGIDTLYGGVAAVEATNGNDTYVWSSGQGNDTIFDKTTEKGEVDTLVLSGVDSSAVQLTQRLGDYDLVVTVGSEQITVLGQFTSTTASYGIERIEFADDVAWNLEDILVRTTYSGDTTANSLSGTSFGDNIFGLDGNDTITAVDGNDKLVGGKGDDTLNGGNGSDLYLWSTGDGNDIITDTGSSTSEVDTLQFSDLSSGNVVLWRSGSNLLATITVGGTSSTITITDRFANSSNGTGIELIRYADGTTVEVLRSALGELLTTGTVAANTYNGWGYRDVMLGQDGGDSLSGGDGDDELNGGHDNDALYGGNGSDTYVWASGDGNDTITDTGLSLTEIDTLRLTDVNVDEVNLTRSLANPNDLLITMSTGETIKVVDRYYSIGQGRGIEHIEFADGTVWWLDDILSNTYLSGTASGETITGSAYRDQLKGVDGDDILNGGDGNDVLRGGLGADTLNGGNGSDEYVWANSHGNDIINDASASLSDTDVLTLLDATPAQVSLERSSGSNDLLVRVGTSTITVNWRFYSPTDGSGIERINFSDGSFWTLQDILDKTNCYGTDAADSGTTALRGSDYKDNLDGKLGADTIYGYDGDDVIVGGDGNDYLLGGTTTAQSGNGNDHYRWSTGDDNDTINDSATSMDEVDTLELVNVTSSNVMLFRSGYNLLMNIGAETITVLDRFYSDTQGRGIEKILFQDGTSWSLEDILDLTKTQGTSAGETLDGSDYRDNIYGLAGGDTLRGYGGDDLLVGGAGADSLDGGTGVDTASYFLSTQGVIVDLNVTTAQTGATGGEEVGDVLTAIENLKGSDYVDILSGNSSANILYGGAGNDTLNGRDGYDQLFGEAGSDTLDGGLSADVLDGGTGTDTADYNGSNAAVTVNLLTGDASGGYAEGDTLVSIERLKGSNGYGDTLTGDASANTIWGQGGNDVIDGGAGADDLYGGNGADTIIGGTGNDTLTGNADADTFVFATGGGSDTIADFSLSGGDVIKLSLGTSFDTYAEVMAVATASGSNTILTFSATDKITLTGIALSGLTAGDFLFV